jgi:hypothetical protein
LVTDSTLDGSTVIPSADYMCPKNVTFSIQNSYLLTLA